MSDVKFDLKPVKKKPSRKYRKGSKYDPIIDSFMESEHELVKVEVPDTLFIDADERLISQVLTNLISNAIKYSKEFDTIEITAGMFNEEMCEFIVKDEGSGISDTNRDKMFNIGKIFSTEGTKGEKGTGLGLALAKQIIDKHKVLGRLTGHVPLQGELTPDVIYEIMGKILKDHDTANFRKPDSAELDKIISGLDIPVRKPTLCAGCPERAAFFAICTFMVSTSFPGLSIFETFR